MKKATLKPPESQDIFSYSELSFPEINIEVHAVVSAAEFARGWGRSLIFFEAERLGVICMYNNL
jgi:hypothetical protein